MKFHCILCLLIVGFICFLFEQPHHHYLVKITFCDNRKPIIETVPEGLYGSPCDEDIEITRDRPIPCYCHYLNVCAIESIKQVD